MKNRNENVCYDLDCLSFLYEKLDSFNGKFINLNKSSFNVCIKDNQGNIIAGLNAESYGAVFYIKALWVDAQCRGQGKGHLLMEIAENHAVTQGHNRISLDTFSFQAPDFYIDHGYKIIGKLDCGVNITRYYLYKALNSSAPAT